MTLHPGGVDALLGPLAAGQLVQAIDDAFLVEIDRDRAAGLGHAEALRHVVDATI
jgi:hypothetical protein